MLEYWFGLLFYLWFFCLLHNTCVFSVDGGIPCWTFATCLEESPVTFVSIPEHPSYNSTLLLTLEAVDPGGRDVSYFGALREPASYTWIVLPFYDAGIAVELKLGTRLRGWERRGGGGLHNIVYLSVGRHLLCFLFSVTVFLKTQNHTQTILL